MPERGWPYDDELFVPDVALRRPDVAWPPVSEPDYLGELTAPQEPIPEDFFARVAQGSGPTPFAPMQLGEKPTGLEVLLALAGGFVNAKTRRAAGRISETQERNERARAAAKDLANRRWEMRRIQAQSNANLRNILASRGPGKTPEQIEAEAKAGELGRRKGAIEAGETPAEKRARDAADRAVNAANLRERLASFQTVNALGDDYKNDPSIKGYREVRSNLISANTAAKQRSGPGDIALIFSFMRALEPENVNVVREGEFANARQAAGALQRYTNLPNRFFSGTQLTDEGRRYFLRQMGSSLRSREADFKNANAEYLRRAQAFGVDPNLFIREYAAPTPEWIPPGAVPVRE